MMMMMMRRRRRIKVSSDERMPYMYVLTFSILAGAYEYRKVVHKLLILVRTNLNSA